MEERIATIRLFGQFRNYFKQGQITVPVLEKETLRTLKAKLTMIPLESVTKEALSSLLDSSVFASESRVLGADDPLPADLKLALLPPVCGG